MTSIAITYTLALSIISIGAILGLSHLFAELRRQRQPGLTLNVWRVPSLEELQAYALALMILAVLAVVGYGLGSPLNWVVGQIFRGPLGYLAIGGAFGLGIVKLWGFVGRRTLGT
jgi:hypothetical protein